MEADQSVLRTSRKSHTHTRLLWWGRAAITLGLAAYLIWQLHDQLGTLHINLANPTYLTLGGLIAILGVLLSTLLWSILIPRSHSIPFHSLLAHYLLGMLLNNFLPGGIGGDAARAIALNDATGRADISVSSVLMTRLAGLWSIVLMANGAGVLQAIYQESNLSTHLLLITSAALVVTLMFTAFLFGSTVPGVFRHFPPGWVSWYACLRAYRESPARLFSSLAFALGIQVCAFSINLCTAHALDLSISAWQLWLSLPLITLITLLPISIGGFGVREGSYVFLLGLTGTPAADALVLSLSVYILLTLVTAVGAGISLLFISSTGSTLRDRIIRHENPDP
jgi:hypothetical protein